MRKLFNEYGLFLLAVITGAVIIAGVFHTLNDSSFINTVLFTQSDRIDMATAEQEAVTDETIYTDGFKFQMGVFDAVVKYGSGTFDYMNYIKPSSENGNIGKCVSTCFVVTATPIDKDKNETGPAVDISRFLTMDFVDSAGISEEFNSKIPGEHNVTYTLRWNGFNIKKTQKVYVLDDPNKPNISDPDLLNNMIMGSIVDKSGNPIANERVRLQSNSADGTTLSFDTVTSESGSFTFYGMPADQDYEIVALSHSEIDSIFIYYEGGQVSVGKLS